MGKTIDITASDGHALAAYVAEPAGPPKGGMVVLQEFFGVNAHIRQMADEFARDGYYAVAPAIFDRAERGVELAYDAAGMARGRELRASLVLDQTMRDVQAAIRAASRGGRVAVLGYCWGGSLAYLAAGRLDGVACAVAYYGAQIPGWLDDKPRAPVQLHFAGHDDFLNPGDVERVKAALPGVPIYDYPGTEHGFNCNERKFYEPKAAALARKRVLAFTNLHVGD